MQATKGSRGALLTVFLVIFVDLLGFGLVLPLMPFFASEFGASPLTIGLLYSAYSAMQLFFAPFWGNLSDRFGRRPIMMISTLGASISYVIFSFSGSLAILFFSRIMAGAMAGNISAAQAYITDVTDEKNRVKGMGLVGAAFGLGFTLGPALAAWILAMKPSAYALPGLAAAAFSLASFAFVVFLLPETVRVGQMPAAAPKRPNPLQKIFWTSIAGSPDSRLRPLLFCMFAITVAHASLYGAFPLFCSTKFNMSAADVGGLFGVMGLIAVLIQGGLMRRLSGRVDEKKLLFAGTAVMMLGLAAIPLVPTRHLLLIAISILAIGGSLNGPALLSLISKEADPARTGAAMGVSQSASGLARVIGPAWGGLLFGLASPLPFWATTAVLALVLWIASNLLKPLKA